MMTPAITAVAERAAVFDRCKGKNEMNFDLKGC